MSENQLNAHTAITEKQPVIILNTIALCVVVVLSYLMSFISGYSSSGVYAAILGFFIMLYVITKPWQKHSILTMILLWGPAMLVMVISFLRSSHTVSGAFDVVMLLLSVVLCIFITQREKTYESAIKALLIVSLLYAASVFVQCYFPTLFSLLLKIFPATMKEKISVAKGFPGFTINIGFAAAYICTGIFSLIALSIGAEKKSTKTVAVIGLVFLALCLLLTGKRGHKLFICITLLICYFLPAKKSDFLKRLLCAGLVLIVLLAVSELLPFLLPESTSAQAKTTTISETVQDLQAGKDITSARIKLFQWALHLFAENPVLGIGWGDYRTTVVGNATFAKKLDTHNIYLQLLAENGIVGFLCFGIPMLLFWVATLKLYYNCMRGKENASALWKGNILFSFAFQTFFGLYGLVGNPLFDVHYQIVYMLSCGIAAAYYVTNRKKESVEEK